jgi:molecular chaperone DnaJ
MEFDVDLEDIMSDMFGMGGGRKRQRNVRRGRDIEVSVSITLEEVMKGKEVVIPLEKHVKCVRCGGVGAEPGTKVKECFSCRGTGEVQQIKQTFLGSFTHYTMCPECKGEGKIPENPCNVCKGEGRTKGKEELQVFIPAGVDANQALRVEGKGEAGRKGEDPGNLYIRVSVKPHTIFQRKGDDIYTSLEIPFSLAVFGGDLQAPTLEGKNIIVKISSGTESGKILKVSGKGIPHFAGFGRGDLFFRVVVNIPGKVTKKQKEILQELQKEGL